MSLQFVAYVPSARGAGWGWGRGVERVEGGGGSVACVASVSNRVIARELERKQKKVD